LETLLVKAVAARLTKQDKSEILFVPTIHHFITDWTIFAVNLAPLVWLGLFGALDLLACSFFVRGNYASVSNRIGGSRRICKDFGKLGL
jgi:hypothetical protein